MFDRELNTPLNSACLFHFKSYEQHVLNTHYQQLLSISKRFLIYIDLFPVNDEIAAKYLFVEILQLKNFRFSFHQQNFQIDLTLPKTLFFSVFLNTTVELKYKQDSEAYTEPCQISKVKCFAKIVHGFYLLTIFPKSFTIDV